MERRKHLANLEEEDLEMDDFEEDDVEEEGDGEEATRVLKVAGGEGDGQEPILSAGTFVHFL